MTPSFERWKPGERILLLVLALAVSASVAVALSARGGTESSRDFQSTVGGLGLGQSVTLSRCTTAFDARLGPACDLRHGPFPGPGTICPDHVLPRAADR